MFNISSKPKGEKMSGPGYIILNTFRVLNIIALLAVVIASWIMLVRTIQTSNFFFFDATSHFITSTIGLFLIVSELGLFKSYFIKSWPLLSELSGFVSLGLAMIILGLNILGNLNKVATSIENIGLGFWREIIAAGILSTTIGCFNIIASYVFRNRKAGISARQIRSHGAAAPSCNLASSFDKSSSSLRSGSSRRTNSLVLPSYHTSTANERRQSRFNFKFPVRTSEISHPVTTNTEQFKKFEVRSSPIAPDVQRPPTALHPAYSPSRYSTFSGASRF